MLYIVNMLDRRDPDTPEFYDARVRELGRLWKEGRIGEATFLRSLFIMGYRPDEANAELRALKYEKMIREKRN